MEEPIDHIPVGAEVLRLYQNLLTQEKFSLQNFTNRVISTEQIKSLDSVQTLATLSSSISVSIGMLDRLHEEYLQKYCDFVSKNNDAYSKSSVQLLREQRERRAAKEMNENNNNSNNINNNNN